MNIQKLTFDLASNSDAQNYVAEAKDWYNYQRGSENFTDSAGTVVRVIAEYLANQNKQTLFKSKQ